MTAAGLRYVWVPLSAATMSVQDVEAVEKVLADHEAGPVLIHCTAANGVGAMHDAVRRVLGLPAE